MQTQVQPNKFYEDYEKLQEDFLLNCTSDIKESAEMTDLKTKSDLYNYFRGNQKYKNVTDKSITSTIEDHVDQYKATLTGHEIKAGIESMLGLITCNDDDEHEEEWDNLEDESDKKSLEEEKSNETHGELDEEEEALLTRCPMRSRVETMSREKLEDIRSLESLSKVKSVPKKKSSAYNYTYKDYQMPRSAIRSLIKEILAEYKTVDGGDYRLGQSALDVMHEASEEVIEGMFKRGSTVLDFFNVNTLTTKHLELQFALSDDAKKHGYGLSANERKNVYADIELKKSKKNKKMNK